MARHQLFVRCFCTTLGRATLGSAELQVYYLFWLKPLLFPEPDPGPAAQSLLNKTRAETLAMLQSLGQA